MGDKDDLQVSYRLLEDSETSLKTIHREFDRCTDRQDTLGEAVGAGQLRDALHEFADNWSDNRKQTLANIEEFRKMVTKVKESFQHLDKDLADKAERD